MVSRVKLYDFYLELEAFQSENATRPAYRSTLSQPSQMGSFKHQSIRTGDRERERDRDPDKDRERDLREKEGQERLRNVSFFELTIMKSWNIA